MRSMSSKKQEKEEMMMPGMMPGMMHGMMPERDMMMPEMARKMKVKKVADALKRKR